MYMKACEINLLLNLSYYSFISEISSCIVLKNSIQFNIGVSTFFTRVFPAKRETIHV